MKEDLKLAIKEMAEGKETGFNKVYSETYQHVYFRAKELMKEEQDALDLVQNVYVEAYKGIKSLQSGDALFGWLDGIIYRQGMKLFRKKKDVLLTEENEGMFDVLEDNDIAGMPELSAEQKETAEIIKSLLNELPELQKMALISYYYDGHSVSEIAGMQECSEGTIKSRLNYARKALKEKVEEKEKKDGYRLHVFALPTLWFAIKLLSEETVMTESAAQSVYNASCKEIGLKATTISMISEGADIMKKTGLKMKLASLGMGGKIAATIAVVVVAGGITTGAVTVTSHNNETKDNASVIATETTVKPTTETPILAEKATEEPATEIPTAETIAEQTEGTPAAEPVTEAPVAEPAQMETTMWSTTSVNVRAEASKDSNKLGTLAQGDTVVVLGDTASEWVTVSYNGGTGYVKGSFLSSTEVAKAVPVKKAAKKTEQTTKTNNADTAQVEQPQQAASAPAQTEQPQQAAPAQESAPAATPAPAPAIESQPAQSEQQPSNVDLNPDGDTSDTPEYHDNPGAGVNSGLPY